MSGREVLAAVVADAGADFELDHVHLGEPREDELLVRIEAAGICHTDLAVAAGHFGTPFPIVLGHESAGTVETVGSGVRSIAPGDRVVMSACCCGRCRNCLRGRPAYCYEMWERNFAGARLDGSTSLARGNEPIHSHFLGQSAFATYAVCAERSVTKIETEIPAPLLAPFGCAIQTGAGSVLNVLEPEPEDGLAIFGVGAVGMAAVMAANLIGCSPLVVVDPNADRRALAHDLGATHSIDPGSSDVLAEIRSIAAHGLEFTLEMSGVQTALEQAILALAPGGVCGLVGAPPMGTHFPLDVHEVIDPGRTIQGIVLGGGVPQVFLPELVDLWAQGRLPVERLVETFPFEEVDAAIESARTGSVIKPVLEMS